jgi:hypothetical protein
MAKFRSSIVWMAQSKICVLQMILFIFLMISIFMVFPSPNPEGAKFESQVDQRLALKI